MSWWSGHALGFDFESDGPVPAEARAITCAMVRVEPGGQPSELEVMLQPERDIPAEATAMHGITTERARAEGQLREVAIASIAATLAEVLSPGVPIVGHNVVYDLTLLDREMRRIGLGWLELEQGTDFVVMIDAGGLVFGGPFPVVDTMVLDKTFDRYRPGARKLEQTALVYGVPMADGAAHGATADAVASLRIAITIANRGGFRDMDLAELHGAQVRWKAEQARGLAQYWRANPDKAKGEPDKVSEAWPVQPFTEAEAGETAGTAF